MSILNLQKSGILKIILMLIASVTLTQCGPNSQQWRNQAPTNDTETGYVVIGADKEQIQDLLNIYPDAMARTLNVGYKMYEVFNLDKKTLKTQLSNTRIYKNKMVQTQWGEHRIQKFKTMANEQVTLQNLCQNSFATTYLPKAKVNVVEMPNEKFAKTLTLNIGETLKMSAEGSQSHPNVGGEVENLWFMLPPETSNLQPTTAYKANQVEFSPDSLGAYLFMIIARDKRGVCSQRNMFQVGVTSNEPLKKVSPVLVQDAFDNNRNFREAFFHLDQIKAYKSWEISTGKGATIAILDSGVNYNHPALNKNIKINEKEIPNNGIDDDNNSLVDDYFGYDFTYNDSFPYDDAGHGSHVAGLAASNVFGLAKDAKILPVKVMSAFGSGDMGSIAAGVLYATQMKVDCINMSLGSLGSPLPIMEEVIEFANKQGIPVVIAAGNGDPQTGAPLDIDRTPVYPAAYGNDNIITVAASNGLNQFSPFSNYGVETVDITAPGGSGAEPSTQILSCYAENNKEQLFKRYSGTSMAAPIVSGVIAQMKALDRNLLPVKIKQILLESGITKSYLQNTTVSGKHLDADNALKQTKLFLSQQI